jgi:hypothetical protein
MPKTAAAVLGFALVTGSIGFNTVRYPVVWKMVGSVDPSKPASESPPAIVVPPPPMPESPPPIALRTPEPTTVRTDNYTELAETKQESTSVPESTPTPETADKAATVPPAAADTGEISPNSPATTGSEEGQKPMAEESRKPLVPVPPVSISKDAAGNVRSSSGFVRLPPVDFHGLGSNGYDTSRLFSGTLPNYPSTETR